jgi:magnesium transporter
MVEELEQQEEQTIYQSFSEALEKNSLAKIHGMLSEMHPAEIANILESLPTDTRQTVWGLVTPSDKGDILVYLNENLQSTLINNMDSDELLEATEGLETDDLADLLPNMPEDVIQEVIRTLDEQNRQRLESALSYPEDTAGGLMNMDTIQVRADITIDVVQRYLRRIGTIPDHTDNLMVVDRENHFLGLLPLTTVLTSDTTATVSDVMKHDAEGIRADSPAEEVTKLFELRDLITAPVIDENGMLLGRITIDDVVDVIRDKAEHSFMSMAGLDEEEDLFAPVAASTKRRTVWLGVNMLTAILASWVIGLFDATLEQLVALAILMPIVASMGGIAGNQTLALVIRGMALGHIGERNAYRLVVKEVSIGLLNGLFWSVVIGAASYLWFGSELLGLVIAAAMFVNLLVAALSGATIPMLLRRMGIDPALAGGVVLTTVTDVIGFMSFLGLASLFLV